MPPMTSEGPMTRARLNQIVTQATSRLEDMVAEERFIDMIRDIMIDALEGRNVISNEQLLALRCMASREKISFETHSITALRQFFYVVHCYQLEREHQDDTINQIDDMVRRAATASGTRNMVYLGFLSDVIMYHLILSVRRCLKGDNEITHRLDRLERFIQEL